MPVFVTWFQINKLTYFEGASIVHYSFNRSIRNSREKGALREYVNVFLISHCMKSSRFQYKGNEAMNWMYTVSSHKCILKTHKTIKSTTFATVHEIDSISLQLCWREREFVARFYVRAQYFIVQNDVIGTGISTLFFIHIIFWWVWACICICYSFKLKGSVFFSCK